MNSFYTYGFVLLLLTDILISGLILELEFPSFFFILILSVKHNEDKFNYTFLSIYKYFYLSFLIFFFFCFLFFDCV